jgi:MSHA biogenesis protein MshL
MKKLVLILLLLAAGCQTPLGKRPTTLEQINDEMARAVRENAKPAAPDAVSQALLPPLKIAIPASGMRAVEPKFDLVVNNAPANQVFMGIVSGTRYSMLVHPDVAGSISVNLKDVTVLEALDAIRELYGYDYKLEGTRIYVQPLTLQTHIFQVNYLTSLRKGTSEITVTSGSISNSSSGSSTPAGSTTSPTTTSTALQSSKISTTSNSDFWGELKAALSTIVGSENGRSLVVSPQSGVVVVRAMPAEIRAVQQYLRATQISVDRQVILEAKIIEVTLSDGAQSGINWANFGKNSQFSSGMGANAGNVILPSGALSPTTTLSSLLGGGLASASGATTGGIFGLAFRTSSFAALLEFLESQGTISVLSSPRIATLNNQKAVLKVGTDAFFVTNVSTSTTTGTATTSSPSVTLQPFFSGIALDVTPQIDENNNITLHIHPSVSDVTSVNTSINLGASGTLNLPLASSAVSETDSIVRAQDGQVVAIGGLMRSASISDNSQIPGAGDVPIVGELFKHSSRSVSKRELVILLKPTVVKGNDSWSQNILESQRNIQNLQR